MLLKLVPISNGGGVWALRAVMFHTILNGVSKLTSRWTDTAQPYNS